MSPATNFHAFRPTRRGQRQAGYSLVEFMVGAILLTIAGMATVGIVMHMGRQNVKAQTQSRALALQSEVVGALSRPETFAGSTQLATMRIAAQGTGSVNTTVNDLPLVTPAGQTIAISGRRVGLDANFNPCDPTTPSCPLRVDLALRCSASVGCSAAYRVTISAAANPVASAAYGAPMRATLSASGRN